MLAEARHECEKNGVSAPIVAVDVGGDLVEAVAGGVPFGGEPVKCADAVGDLACGRVARDLRNQVHLIRDLCDLGAVVLGGAFHCDMGAVCVPIRFRRAVLLGFLFALGGAFRSSLLGGFLFHIVAAVRSSAAAGVFLPLFLGSPCGVTFKVPEDLVAGGAEFLADHADIKQKTAHFVAWGLLAVHVGAGDAGVCLYDSGGGNVQNKQGAGGDLVGVEGAVENAEFNRFSRSPDVVQVQGVVSVPVVVVGVRVRVSKPRPIKLGGGRNAGQSFKEIRLDSGAPLHAVPADVECLKDQILFSCPNLASVQDGAGVHFLRAVGVVGADVDVFAA